MGFDPDDLRKLLEEAGVDAEPGAPEQGLGTVHPWAEGGEQPGDDGAGGQAEVIPTVRRNQTGSGEEPPTNTAMYFRDISATMLLTAEQEIELAQVIERGEDARHQLLHGAETLSEPARDELQTAITLSDCARGQLTEANLRLVVSVARKYLNRGLPLLDLIQEGNIGLARAVERYDWSKGYRFSTYAYWWIRQGMTSALSAQSRSIRVPTHMVAAIGDVYKAARDLQQELGREPRVQEIAERLDLSAERVDEIRMSSRQPLSLETPLGGDESSGTLGDLIADRGLATPHDMAERAMLRRHMDDAMQVLSVRERQVLRLRFGLDGDREHTLGEIANQLGVTSERIRQIESGALNKLRQPKMKHKLREYLDEYVVA